MKNQEIDEIDGGVEVEIYPDTMMPESTKDKKITKLGYVAGIIYPTDGGEWLYGKRGLVSITTASDPDAQIFPTIEKVVAFAKKLTHPMFHAIVRPYWSESYIVSESFQKTWKKCRKLKWMQLRYGTP